MGDDELQRLTRLEVQFEHLQKALDDTYEKVTAMHDLLLQAKGAKYLIVGMAAAAGFMSSFAAKLFPFMGSLPK